MTGVVPLFPLTAQNNNNNTTTATSAVISQEEEGTNDGPIDIGPHRICIRNDGVVQ